ncbi:MAG: PBSX family phage terminase large subunit, partial [Fusobacteriaceae bacterium]
MIINYRENNHHFGGFIVNWHKRFYFVVGGYGSSKSYNTALKLLIKARDEKKRKILVVRKTFESLRDSCFDLLCEIIETSGMSKEFKITSTPMRIIHKKTKSRFIFRGLDKPEKLKSIHGVSIVWIEEAPEISYEAFKELNGRLRTMEQSMHIIMSSNPVSKSSWTYKHFFLDKELDDNELYHKRIIKTEDTYYHHSTVDDNKFVPEEYKQQLEQLQHHDPDLYRIARKGRFGILGEKLFRNVEQKSHSEVMEEVERINCRDRFDGLDFGFSVSFNAL